MNTTYDTFDEWFVAQFGPHPHPHGDAIAERIAAECAYHAALAREREVIAYRQKQDAAMKGWYGSPPMRSSAACPKSESQGKSS